MGFQLRHVDGAHAGRRYARGVPVVENVPIGTHEHLVAFADDERALIRCVVEFLSEGFDSDETAIVIATDRHRLAIEDALRVAGYSPSALRHDARLMTLDVEGLLGSTANDGTDRIPEPLSSLVLSTAGSGRRVRVFGELVGALWDAGRVETAVALEAYWTALVVDRRISKFCTYRLASVAAGGELLHAKRLCDQHTRVVPLAVAPDRTVPRPVDRRGVVCSQVFVPAPDALRFVRRFVESVVGGWGHSSIVADATIVIGEMATNAVVHAASPFELSIVRRPGTIRAVVRDTSQALPELRPPSVDRPGGRGMILVDAFSSAWGVDPEPAGKAVWAEFAIVEDRDD